jgi:hypothetical protein
MASEPDVASNGGTGRFPWWTTVAVLGIAGIVALVAVLTLLGDEPTEDDRGAGQAEASLPDGTSTVAGVAGDLPEGAVPTDATSVESTVARSDGSLSAAVTYEVDRAPLAILSEVEVALGEQGWSVRTRSGDATTDQVVLDAEDGTVLTVTVRGIDTGSAVAVVLTAR